MGKLSTRHQLKTQEKEDSRRGFYNSQEKDGIGSTLGKTSKSYAAQYYQLRTGHGVVRTFFAGIGAIETPKCWWCGIRKQTVVHLFTKYRRWRRERRKPIGEPGKQSITWQAKSETGWLASLFADKRAIGSLLKFLSNTEVGSREGAAERELE